MRSSQLIKKPSNQYTVLIVGSGAASFANSLTGELKEKEVTQFDTSGSTQSGDSFIKMEGSMPVGGIDSDVTILVVKDDANLKYRLESADVVFQVCVNPSALSEKDKALQEKIKTSVKAIKYLVKDSSRDRRVDSSDLLDADIQYLQKLITTKDQSLSDSDKESEETQETDSNEEDEIVGTKESESDQKKEKKSTFEEQVELLIKKRIEIDKKKAEKIILQQALLAKALKQAQTIIIEGNQEGFELAKLEQEQKEKSELYQLIKENLEALQQIQQVNNPWLKKLITEIDSITVKIISKKNISIQSLKSLLEIILLMNEVLKKYQQSIDAYIQMSDPKKADILFEGQKKLLFEDVSKDYLQLRSALIKNTKSLIASVFPSEKISRIFSLGKEEAADQALLIESIRYEIKLQKQAAQAAQEEKERQEKERTDPKNILSASIDKKLTDVNCLINACHSETLKKEARKLYDRMLNGYTNYCTSKEELQAVDDVLTQMAEVLGLYDEVYDARLKVDCVTSKESKISALVAKKEQFDAAIKKLSEMRFGLDKLFTSNEEGDQMKASIETFVGAALFVGGLLLTVTGVGIIPGSIMMGVGAGLAAHGIYKTTKSGTSVEVTEKMVAAGKEIIIEEGSISPRVEI